MTTISIMTIAFWVLKLCIAAGIISFGVRILIKTLKKLFKCFDKLTDN